MINHEANDRVTDGLYEFLRPIIEDALIHLTTQCGVKISEALYDEILGETTGVVAQNWWTEHSLPADWAWDSTAVETEAPVKVEKLLGVLARARHTEGETDDVEDVDGRAGVDTAHRVQSMREGVALSMLPYPHSRVGVTPAIAEPFRCDYGEPRVRARS
jgi:hypothetical protein